jgi:dihydrofolate synthase/folylpolyglutamate synthase
MTPGRSLPDWLNYLETLHPRTIEFGLDRVNQVKDRLGLSLDCPVITVGGTNGKGSTCAFLEAILLQAGYRVGLYTSPHLLRFNERARLQGVSASDEQWISQFEAVEAARTGLDPAVSLTYFEFTTLAALRLFQHAALDVAILEVGMGGRLDAVNCIDADCAIVTSIDLDHQEYLGPTREKIAWEKAHIYRPGRPAICADPVAPASLVEVAQHLGADLWLFGRDFNYSGDPQQWAYGGRQMRRSGLAYPALRGANQLLNASAALAALEALHERLPVTNQAIRTGFALVELPGRFQVLAGRPTVILDVAHNPHAASVLARNLDQMGFYPSTHAVFGCMRDKDIIGVLKPLLQRVDHWHLTPLPGARAAQSAELLQALQAAGFEEDKNHHVQQYHHATKAWAGACSQARENDRIVVFGSFVTVAEIMPALEQRHALSQESEP